MSEMTPSKALAEVKKFAQFIRAFENIQEVAEFLSQATNLVGEADKRRLVINSETENQLEEIDQLKAQTQQARQTLLETLADTKARAETIMADARAAAADLTAQASHKVKAAEKSYDSLREAISKTSQELDKIKAEYTQVTRQMAKVREGIRAFVGAD